MENDSTVLKTQTYSFFEILKFLLYRENKVVTNLFLKIGMIYFIFIITIMMIFKNAIVILILWIISCTVFMIFFLSKVQQVYKLQRRWEQYGFNTEKQLQLLEKDKMIFIKDGYRFINLSNSISKGIVSFIDRKDDFIFYLKYLNLFFIIGKTDLNYKKIRNYLSNIESHQDTMQPKDFFYKEKIAGLYYGLPFSNKVNSIRTFQYICTTCLLIIAYIFIAVWYCFIDVSNFGSTLSFGILHPITIFSSIVGTVIFCFFIIWRLYEFFRTKNRKDIFIKTYKMLDIYVNQDMVIMKNPIYCIQMPFQNNIISNITAKAKGHFFIGTKYGNFYINIPELDVEMIQKISMLFQSHADTKRI